jgi:hypothetical protein
MINRRLKQMYVHVPLSWFAAASQLPGKTAIIASLLHLQAGLQRGDLWHNERHGLPGWLLEECGIDRHTLYRALRVLETARLIRVQRKPGCKPAITIIEPDEESLLRHEASIKEIPPQATTASSSKNGSLFDDIEALRASNLATMAAMQANQPQKSRRARPRKARFLLEKRERSVSPSRA